MEELDELLDKMRLTRKNTSCLNIDKQAKHRFDEEWKLRDPNGMPIKFPANILSRTLSVLLSPFEKKGFNSISFYLLRPSTSTTRVFREQERRNRKTSAVLEAECGRP